MSEPTNRDLEQARGFIENWADKELGKGNRPCGWPAFGSVGYEEVCRIIATIRAEEKAKSGKLAEALRWLAKWQHDGKDPGHCNPKIEDCPHHACKRAMAALAAWEGAKHD